MNAPDEGRVVIWRQADGFWRWRWTPTPANDDDALVSHRAFDSLSEARESAHEAYPDAPVEEPQEAEAAPRRRSRRRRILTIVGLLALLVVARRHRDAAGSLMRSGRDPAPDRSITGYRLCPDRGRRT